MISINEDEVLVVFKKSCDLVKALDIMLNYCYLKGHNYSDDNLWNSHHILMGILKSDSRSDDALQKLNSDYREFVEVAVYNYEDSRYIK